MMVLQEIINNYRATGELSHEEIVFLLGLEKPDEVGGLLALANEVREKHLGPDVHLRGIIEFSNHCVRRCVYCGLCYGNRELKRYRMHPHEILDTAAGAVEMGFRTIVLQSGEDFHYTNDMIAYLVAAVKKMGAAVTLSLGDRPQAAYTSWKAAGADRYLLKFETSDTLLYRQLHPESTLARRLKNLTYLRDLGYQLGSGNMVGLPGQTITSLANDILLMKELSLDMAGIGPFLPHPATPLGKARAGTMEMTLKVLAVTRLLLPRTHLPATTALGSVQEDGRRAGLLAGANVLMLNLTPVKYRALYDIYPAKAEATSKPQQLKEEAEKLVDELGRRVSSGYGHAVKIEYQ